MQDIRVTLIQTNQFWEDKQANFNHLENQFFNKIEKGLPDLILLPEMFNTGFSMQTQDMAEEMNGTAVKWLMNWAKRLDAWIGASLIIHDEGNYYNRFVIVSGDGIESFYDKRHLFRMANEHNYFDSGQNRVIVELKGWKIFLQVCYDLRFPVFSRNRTIDGKKEYDVLLYIANWPMKRNFIWKNLIQARAIENQAYCLGLNRVGSDGNGIEYSGDSMVIDPWGNILSQAEPRKEAIITAKLKKSVLDNITTSFPAFLDADRLPDFD